MAIKHYRTTFSETIGINHQKKKQKKFVNPKKKL